MKERKNRWTKESAIKSLKDNGAIVGDRSIALTKETGIKLLGAADYLSKVHGYRITKQ